VNARITLAIELARVRPRSCDPARHAKADHQARITGPAAARLAFVLLMLDGWSRRTGWRSAGNAGCAAR